MLLMFFEVCIDVFLEKGLSSQHPVPPPPLPLTILSISFSLSLLVVPQSTPWSKLIVTHVGNSVKQQCHGSTEHRID